MFVLNPVRALVVFLHSTVKRKALFERDHDYHFTNPKLLIIPNL